MMGLEFMGEEPFHTVYVHALVRDKNGAKMSKSKGNVVDPLDLIDEFGADALRFTLAIMAAQGRDVKLDPQRVAGYRNFGTKLWNATRFAEMNGAVHGGNLDPKPLSLPLNRWIVTELARTIAETERALEGYRFNEAAAALYRFVWNLFCDWYVELAKPALTGEDEAAGRRGALGHGRGPRPDLRAAASVHAVHHRGAVAGDGARPAREPALPCGVAEARLRRRGCGRRHELADRDRVADPLRALGDERAGRVRGRTGGRRAGSGDGGPAGAERRGRAAAGAAGGDRITPEAPEQSAQIVVAGATFALPLAGMIDIAAERARLAKARARLVRRSSGSTRSSATRSSSPTRRTRSSSRSARSGKATVWRPRSSRPRSSG